MTETCHTKKPLTSFPRQRNTTINMPSVCALYIKWASLLSRQSREPLKPLTALNCESWHLSGFRGEPLLGYVCYATVGLGSLQSCISVSYHFLIQSISVRIPNIKQESSGISKKASQTRTGSARYPRLNNHHTLSHHIAALAFGMA